MAWSRQSIELRPRPIGPSSTRSRGRRVIQGSGIRDQGSRTRHPVNLERPDPRSRIPDPDRVHPWRATSSSSGEARSRSTRAAFSIATPFSRCSIGSSRLAPPWDAIDWSPQVHLVLFVHRVQDMTPGIYAYLRDVNVLGRMEGRDARENSSGNLSNRRARVRAPANSRTPRTCSCSSRLTPDRIANRLSCDQDIAEDGFFSLGMLARFEEPLRDARRVVLPPVVLGVRPDRPGAVSRSRSRWRPRDRHRLLLRRAGARLARTLGARLAKPVSLLDGITSRRQRG